MFNDYKYSDNYLPLLHSNTLHMSNIHTRFKSSSIASTVNNPSMVFLNVC